MISAPPARSPIGCVSLNLKVPTYGGSRAAHVGSLAMASPSTNTVPSSALQHVSNTVQPRLRRMTVTSACTFCPTCGSVDHQTTCVGGLAEKISVNMHQDSPARVI